MPQFCDVFFYIHVKLMVDRLKMNLFIFLYQKQFLKVSLIGTVIKPVLISVLFVHFLSHLRAQVPEGPDTVTVSSGVLLLKGLLWRPVGTGVFPTVIFCHGSYETNDLRYDVVQQTSVLGPLFAKNGYIFLGLFRQGTGLSKTHGENSADLMSKAIKEKGQEERNRVQMLQLQTNDLQDMNSGLALLRKRNDVDKNRIAVIGHSFGGALALLVGEHDPGIKAVITFGAAGFSWNVSSQLRARLIDAVKKINVPVMLVYSQNDYSLSPAYSLDSVMNVTGKQHLLKIYPSYGSSSAKGHNIIFLKADLWEQDVFNFLREHLH